MDLDAQKEVYAEDIKRASLARQWLDNPMYQEAKINIQGDLYGKFNASPSGPEGAAVREGIHVANQAFDRLVTYLESVITGGEFAVTQLESLSIAESTNLKGL